MDENNKCLASYNGFAYQCYGEVKTRELIIYYQEFHLNEKRERHDIENICLCDFHYNFLKNADKLKMHGNSLYEAEQNLVDEFL
jgi:hypothetical protein